MLCFFHNSNIYFDILSSNVTKGRGNASIAVY